MKLMKLCAFACVLLLGAGWAGNAAAIPFLDHKSPLCVLDGSKTCTTTHDVSGFGIPVPNLVTHAWLVLTFWDPNITKNVEVEVALNEVHESSHSLNLLDLFTLSVDPDHLNLNNGILDVSITGGDCTFLLGCTKWLTSTLKGKTTPVPEPGSIALIGASLLGVGYMRRRRAARV